MKTRILCLGVSLLALHFTTAAPADYVAHEWGTFTSVQGADGVQLSWNPLLLTELPKFVYDRSRLRPKPGAPVFFGKTAMMARQRLETPVIYFYSKAERRVDVRVMFPEGSVTEWYPQQNPLPARILKAGEPAAQWKNLRILAAGAKSAEPPREATGSHYYAARETDANRVEMTPEEGAKEVDAFLFYRGVGNFEAPLKVVSEGTDGQNLRLSNTGKESLGALFIYQVVGTQARLTSLPALAAGETRDVAFVEKIALAPLADVRAKLERQMCAALAADGLHTREAVAMVKTWDDAWFAEPGMRVLYLLPRAWTDRTLPLALDPAPRELERVMVGRAEILTPAVEKALTQEVERFSGGDETMRAVALKNARALGLGRFAEPAMRRVCAGRSKDQAFNTAAWELLYAAYAPLPPKPAAPATAQR